MTWLDVALVTVVVLSIAVGARLGSLWTAACLGGGFVGAFIADMYAMPLAGSVTQFPGSVAVAGVVLFALGAAVVIVPGLLLSKLFSGMILGLVDSAFGLLLGGVIAMLAVTTLLLVVVPFAPSVEASAAWKKSAVVRPLHRRLEHLFQTPRFRRRLSGLEAAKGAFRELKPMTERAGERIKDAAENVIQKAKG